MSFNLLWTIGSTSKKRNPNSKAHNFVITQKSLNGGQNLNKIKTILIKRQIFNLTPPLQALRGWNWISVHHFLMKFGPNDPWMLFSTGCINTWVSGNYGWVERFPQAILDKLGICLFGTKLSSFCWYCFEFLFIWSFSFLFKSSAQLFLYRNALCLFSLLFQYVWKSFKT